MAFLLSASWCGWVVWYGLRFGYPTTDVSSYDLGIRLLWMFLHLQVLWIFSWVLRGKDDAVARWIIALIFIVIQQVLFFAAWQWRFNVYHSLAVLFVVYPVNRRIAKGNWQISLFEIGLGTVAIAVLVSQFSGFRAGNLSQLWYGMTTDLQNALISSYAVAMMVLVGRIRDTLLERKFGKLVLFFAALLILVKFGDIFTARSLGRPFPGLSFADFAISIALGVLGPKLGIEGPAISLFGHPVPSLRRLIAAFDKRFG